MGFALLQKPRLVLRLAMYVLYKLSHVYTLSLQHMCTHNQSLTIGIVCTTRTPSQDIIGICLHSPSIVLPPLQPRRGKSSISVFCDGDLRKSMDCGAGE
jgi:hypothetical protein